MSSLSSSSISSSWMTQQHDARDGRSSSKHSIPTHFIPTDVCSNYCMIHADTYQCVKCKWIPSGAELLQQLRELPDVIERSALTGMSIGLMMNLLHNIMNVHPILSTDKAYRMRALRVVWYESGRSRMTLANHTLIDTIPTTWFSHFYLHARNCLWSNLDFFKRYLEVGFPCFIRPSKEEWTLSLYAFLLQEARHHQEDIKTNSVTSHSPSTGSPVLPPSEKLEYLHENPDLLDIDSSSSEYAHSLDLQLGRNAYYLTFKPPLLKADRCTSSMVDRKENLWLAEHRGCDPTKFLYPKDVVLDRSTLEEGQLVFRRQKNSWYLTRIHRLSHLTSSSTLSSFTSSSPIQSSPMQSNPNFNSIECVHGAKLLDVHLADIRFPSFQCQSLRSEWFEEFKKRFSMDPTNSNVCIDREDMVFYIHEQHISTYIAPVNYVVVEAYERGRLTRKRFRHLTRTSLFDAGILTDIIELILHFLPMMYLEDADEDDDVVE